MKKFLAVFLILAVAGGVFAQEQGLQLGGSLKTGLKFATGQNVIEEDENIQGWKAEDKDPSMAVYHDDAGAVRFDLEGSYTKDNYGVVFRLRFSPQYEDGDIKVNTTDLLHQGYVWADLANEKVNVKAGKIDDAAWSTAGDEEFYYSTGVGLRLEVKPIPGLNVGFFLNGTNTGDDGESLASTDGLFEAAEYFFAETGFGVKFEHDLLDIAAGFRLDSKRDGLNLKEDLYKWSTSEFEDDDAALGHGAYIGVDVKAVENLTLAVEAQFNNLGKFNTYGWVWINEVIKYQVTEQLNVGIVMHQFLFGSDHLFAPTKDDNSVTPLLKFNPQVSYDLNDKWNVGLEIPLEFWPEIVTYNIGVKPKVTYKLGENAAIAGYYQLGVLQYDKNTGFGKNGDAPDATINHTVQINFEWSF